MSYVKSIAMLAVSLAASSAFAAITGPAGPTGKIAFSQNVTPDAIFGTGGVDNGGFTTATTGSLQLGLRARMRYTNETDDNGNGTYGYFATGPGPDAVWNFDFSVNSSADGRGPTLAGDGLTFVLGADFNPLVGAATYQTFNLSTTCLDSQFGRNTTGNDAGIKADCSAAAGTAKDYYFLMETNTVMQNSENLGFFTPNGGNVPGEYSFYLQAVNRVGTVVAETDITVNVGTAPVGVPEPGSVALVGLGLAGLGLTSRRRKASR